MIRYISGDILTSDAEALVNTVNTVGVMGKGIALQFKKAFPNNFKLYHEACKNGELQIGKLLVTTDSNLNYGKKIIINFPTKKDWRKSSEYQYIEDGLEDLIIIMQEYHIKSIAIPPLGAGNGGLEWEKVKWLIENKLGNLNAEITIYEPNYHIKECLKAERVKLTDARALLLYVLYDLVKNGSYVSEFSSEKVCYFMQRFGAQKYFKLEYTPQFYGPYSGKVRYLLAALNGSYIMGYSDMNKKPFEPLTLVADGYESVTEYIEKRPDLKAIVSKTLSFLSGFYSDFALELLSSVDYIAHSEKSLDKTVIVKKLNLWNDRKRSLFNNMSYIDISVNHVKLHLYSNALG